MEEGSSFSMKLDDSSHKIVMEHLESKDKEVFDFFSETPEDEREGQLLTAVKMGVLALKTVGNAERVDYVEIGPSDKLVLLNPRHEQVLSEQLQEGRLTPLLTAWDIPDPFTKPLSTYIQCA